MKQVNASDTLRQLHSQLQVPLNQSRHPYPNRPIRAARSSKRRKQKQTKQKQVGAQ